MIMGIEKKQISVPSSDGVHTLKGVIYIPQGEIKGLFHVVHGMCEHIGRYDSFMQKICEKGYITAGYDHLGHGKTVNDKSELGFFASEDGYKLLVRDVDVFCKRLKEQYKDLPYILFGHSMGSFIVRLAAEEFKGDFDKLIICGTGGPNPASGIGLKLTDIIRKRKGEKTFSPLVESLAFGSFNKGFEGYSRYDWLTKDHEIVDDHANDELCQFRFTVSAMYDLIMLNKLSNRKEWFWNLPKELPVLLVSGDKDPVGNKGKGVKQVYAKLCAAGQEQVAMKLYENCRHEIHNDTCKDEMFKDVMNFVEG